MKFFRHVTANTTKLVEFPFFRELAMEAYLIENQEVLSLDNGDFEEVTVLDAEIALKAGRKSAKKNGRIDILAQYGQDYLAIVEVKKAEINKETLSQLKDYLDQKDQIVEKHPEFWINDKEAPKWIGVMVGNSISPELQDLLQKGYSIDGVPIAGMVIRRFTDSKGEIFVITDNFFKFDYRSKDYSKFKFRGETFNKSRLVNKVVKVYAEENPTITFAKLAKVIPQHLQGKLGVFMSVNEAQEILNNTSYKRHYLKPEELIELADIKIATCNQWGVGNIEYFIKHINTLGKNWKIENI